MSKRYVSGMMVLKLQPFVNAGTRVEVSNHPASYNYHNSGHYPSKFRIFNKNDGGKYPEL
jgi:hypothetical protein